MALISHKYKFVFLHVQKTAGSCMTSVLRRYTDVETRQHASSMEVIDGGLACPDYTWVMFVRNPWDRLVSWYHYHQQKEATCISMSFEEWINWIYPKPRQVDFINNFILPKLIVGRYENIDHDFNEIFSDLIEPGIVLGKPENVTEHDHYTKYYTDELLKSEEVQYFTDLDSKRFGYRYEY